MIDERALEAACEAYVTAHNSAPAGSIAPLHEMMLVAIEAYEDARPEPNPWRPIEEAPRDGTEVFISWDGTLKSAGLFWVGDPMAPNGWTDGFQWIAASPKAMFRTIDPPKQDGAQGPEDAHQAPTPPIEVQT